MPLQLNASGSAQPEVFQKYRTRIVSCASSDRVAQFVVHAVCNWWVVDNDGQILNSAQEEVAVQWKFVFPDLEHQFEGAQVKNWIGLVIM